MHSSRCALHHVLPSSSSLYLALSPGSVPGRQHNDGKWSARCQGLRGVRGSAACCLAWTPTFIRTAGWAADKTTRDGCEWTNMLISFSQGHRDDYEKLNCQQNNRDTFFQILFSGCSEFICCTAAQMHHERLWGDIWSQLPVLSSASLDAWFSLLICYVIQGTYGSF